MPAGAEQVRRLSIDRGPSKDRPSVLITSLEAWPDAERCALREAKYPQRSF